MGKVWLAAHMERKLSKTQTLQTDIEQSVDAIMGQEIEVMALRLSGQLLLGVVRIYSRKAKYLLDDCNEALLKIKMAFRPGMVDMTEDQLVVNKTSITLQGLGLDLDLLLPDVNWEMDFEDRPIHPQGHHQAHVDDITLRTVDDFQRFDLGDPFTVGPSDGIGSQDFVDVDLGIDWDSEVRIGGEKDHDGTSVDDSVGVGRDAAGRRNSIDSHILGIQDMDVDVDLLSNRSKSRALSEHPFRTDMDFEFPDMGGVDLEDLGVGFGEPGINDLSKLPGQNKSLSRASSPLTDLPDTPRQDVDLAAIVPPTLDLGKVKRKVKEKKQIIDSVTELDDTLGGKVGRGKGTVFGPPTKKDVTDIVTDQRFLPKSSLLLRLLEIRDDPLAYFMPTAVTPNGTFFCAAPPGLAPDLANLFMRPAHTSSMKRRAGSPKKTPSKRPRLNPNNETEDEIEHGRRADSLAPSIAIGSDIHRQGSLGPYGDLEFAEQPSAVDDYQLHVPDFDASGERRDQSAGLSDLSRLSTPGVDEAFPNDGDDRLVDSACPLSIFDVRQSTQTQEVDKDDQEGKGYSKNTVKALGLLRRELEHAVGETMGDTKLSFNRISDKASRRAAASFFFELLVIGTRDCVTLAQAGSFENIEVSAKPKLWDQQRHDVPLTL